MSLEKINCPLDSPTYSIRPVILTFLALAISAIFASAWAHSPSRADLPRYGGEVRQADDLFIELVVTTDRLALYARDRRERVVALKAGQVRALLWTDQGNQAVPLTADGYRLTGTTHLPTGTPVRVIVVLNESASDERSLLFGPISPAVES